MNRVPAPPDLPQSSADETLGDDPSQERTDRWSVWLRRTDYTLVGFIFGLSFLFICASLVYDWWRGRQSIDIDHAHETLIDYRVNLNSADWPELATLPGIGEKLARDIIAFRNENGPFQRHETLLQVNGVGPKKLDQIRPYLLPLQ
jgi:competence protein ComEA